MNPLNLFQAIEAAIATVKLSQLPEGGFSHSSGGRQYTTTFFAANILNCLNAVQSCFDSISGLATMREKAAQFLLEQKNEHWSFNYWARGTHETMAMPYPDDLDDTFVALAALCGWDSKLIDGCVLACVAKMLTALEVAPGGPYRTWLISPDAQPEWRGVDLAVNANIGYFLSLVEIALPKLSQFVEDRIRQGSLRSPYYPETVQPLYFISRFYHGEEQAALARELLVGIVDVISQNSLQNSLKLAMSISALINLGYDEDIPVGAIELLVTCAQNAAFPSFGFCIDPAQNGKTQIAGSSALTAAFCAEALAKYASLGARSVTTFPSDDLLSRIKTIAQARCSKLPEVLLQVTFKLIGEVANVEIVMVPYLAHASIRKQKNIPACLLDELALANLYGWMAYAIYDDIFDGETVDAKQLFVANYFLRELTLQYASLDRDIPGVCDEFRKMMSLVDVANMEGQTSDAAVIVWPEMLADRSLGHALPVLAVFMAFGCMPDSFDGVALIAFFRNYLAARQLHDDAHDWKEDLHRGYVNGATARMFAMRYDEDSVDEAATSPELEKFFWWVAMPRIVNDILRFLEEARRVLATIEIIEDPMPFESLLTRLESAARRTLQEREKAIQFLGLYLLQA